MDITLFCSVVSFSMQVTSEVNILSLFLCEID